MLISGATFVRNAIKYKYPIVESIKSVLPICDEFIVNIGDSEDGTLELIKSIRDPKIRIIHSVWDEALREKGLILSQQGNIALKDCQGKWIFYIQADEAVHEDDLPKIKAKIDDVKDNTRIESLVFKYYHFYGSYYTYQTGRNWYQREVRVIRNSIGAELYGDAQGFRVNNRKPRAVSVDAYVYHYGWARMPEDMVAKTREFDKLYHDDEWVSKMHKDKHIEQYFHDFDNLRYFEKTHPAVMNNTVNKDNLEFITKLWKQHMKTRGFNGILRGLARKVPVGEHKNFVLVKK
ncbi:MAG: glycosyltransferase [Elusimicrobiota bacterium]